VIVVPPSVIGLAPEILVVPAISPMQADVLLTKSAM
jgi:hypothetical protein